MFCLLCLKVAHCDNHVHWKEEHIQYYKTKPAQSMFHLPLPDYPQMIHIFMLCNPLQIYSISSIWWLCISKQLITFSAGFYVTGSVGSFELSRLRDLSRPKRLMIVASSEAVDEFPARYNQKVYGMQRGFKLTLLAMFFCIYIVETVFFSFNALSISYIHQRRDTLELTLGFGLHYPKVIFRRFFMPQVLDKLVP